MTTLTISKEVSKEKDLVVIPKRVYLKFLSWQKKANQSAADFPQPPKKIRYFKPTAKELKALRQAEKDFAKGNFMTIEELKHALAVKN